jgi:hypothetical protein
MLTATEYRQQRETHQTYLQRLATPTPCCGCNQLFRREDVNPVLFGLYLCGKCTKVAHEGSTSARIPCGLTQRPTKSGKWNVRRRAIRSFAQAKTWSPEPIEHIVFAKPSA